jgi:DNA repair exonuclease SbcCD ATPase subunit
MDILAVSYHNIGPFVDQKLSVCFYHNNVLIQWPIGTGKSFLFFDGILYGLYRSKDSRKILNVQSKTGYIKLCIAVDWMVLLIIRQLKSSKSNSCSSSLYTIDTSPQELQQLLYSRLGKTLTHDTDIQPIIQTLPYNLVNFKNESDLQQHLTQLIGDSTVLQYTNFLVQDSGNIFTETKSDRINLLKQIFQLTAIDHAKDILAEHKSHLNALQKIRSDTSTLESKYQSIINKLQSQSIQVDQIPALNRVSIELNRLYGTSLEYAVCDPEILVIVGEYWQSLTELHHRHTNQTQLYQDHLQQLDFLTQQIQAQTKGLADVQSQMQDLRSILDKRDDRILQQYIQDWQIVYTQMNTFTADASLSVLQTYDPQVQTLADADRLITDLIHKGTQGSQQITQFQNSLSWLQVQEKSAQDRLRALQDKIPQDSTHPAVIPLLNQARENLMIQLDHLDQQIAHHDNQIQQYQIQLVSYQQQIDQLSKALQQKSDFFCTKIQGQCPFVSQINESALSRLWAQIADLQNQHQSVSSQLQQQMLDYQSKDYLNRRQILQEQLDHLQDHRKEYVQDYIADMKLQIDQAQHEYQQQNFQSHIQDLQKQIQDIHNENIRIKQLLQESDYRTIQSSYQQFVTLSKQYETIQSRIQALQSQKNMLSSDQQQYQTLQLDSAKIQGQLDQLRIQQHNIQTEVTQIHQDLQHYDVRQQENLITSINQLAKWIQELQHIVWEYRSNQSEAISLKHQLQYVSNLHQIFARDLFLIVLQEILPLVINILNQLLTMVVDYEVSIDIINPNPDKLELDATITDQYGTRSVDSLSGWQKTILKLVWILAVSIYLQVEFIFLDETINNLDNDTVAKVAQLLQDYVKKNNIKLHIITHSKQIQEMNIRDEVVDLSTLHVSYKWSDSNDEFVRN